MTRSQRFTLVAAILGSSVAAIDGTIVNVALPAIQADLGGGLQTQQWIANAYLLALGSLIPPRVAATYVHVGCGRSAQVATYVRRQETT